MLSTFFFFNKINFSIKIKFTQHLLILHDQKLFPNNKVNSSYLS